MYLNRRALEDRATIGRYAAEMALKQLARTFTEAGKEDQEIINSFNKGGGVF